MQNKIKLFIYTIIGLSLPFLIRTTLLSYPIRNISSPYSTIYLHSLDLILIVIWLVIFYKIKKLPFNGQNFVDKLWISLIFFIFLQVLWAKYPLLSWVWGLRVYFILSLIWYVSRFVNLAQQLKHIINGFLIGILAQTIISIMQFYLQKNIGLPIVVESVISSQLAGVAKINILDNTLIRAYGTFPHPNILGFAGVLSLLLIYALQLGKKVSVLLYGFIILIVSSIDHYILTSIQALSIAVLIGLQLLYGVYIDFNKVIKVFLIFILHILIILTFSKTAFILLLILDSIYLTRLTINSMFHVEQFQNRLKSIPRIILNTIALGFCIILWILPYQSILETLSKRILYLEDAIGIIRTNLWLGVGLGQYVVNLSDNRELWQYEPVHNVFVLLLSELGLIGLLLLIVLFGIECYNYIYGYKKQR